MGEKKKLLVVAGAGASVEFGMPSVTDVHTILKGCSHKEMKFRISANSDRSLYHVVYDKITAYCAYNSYSYDLKYSSRKPNYEDVLITFLRLAALYPPPASTSSFPDVLGAFVQCRDFSNIDRAIFVELYQHLICRLVEEFRGRCRKMESLSQDFVNFFDRLSDEFDVAVVTTNYDNLIYRALPEIVTGFDETGKFHPLLIMQRSTWPCLLHLHGSVHFNLGDDAGSVGDNTIRWQENLSKPIKDVSGSNYAPVNQGDYRTPEGDIRLQGSIIAGYGKTLKLDGPVFRTYYSEFERLAYQSDSVLLLGTSLFDTHLRMGFEAYSRELSKLVVVIDKIDSVDCRAGQSKFSDNTTVARILRTFWAASNGDGKGHWAVKPFNEGDHFECVRGQSPVSFWYGGMLEACKKADVIIQELHGG